LIKHAVPNTTSDAVQTAVLKPFPNTEFLVTTIAMAGKQKRRKKLQGFDKKSCDLPAHWSDLAMLARPTTF
jgi:hypothetical protein